MTRDRGEWAAHAASHGRDAAGARVDGTLAPVAYLPWAVPEHAGTDRAVVPVEAAPAEAAPAEAAPAEAAAVEAAPVEVAPVDAAPAPFTRGRREQYGDDTETGAERDARLDRLIVGRLRRSQLSVAEVRALLVEHGLDDDEIAEWIERYERLGYLDDRRAAEQLVRVHHERRGRGSLLVRQELLRRGIDEQLAREALEGIDDGAELEAARRLAARRAGQLRGLDRAVAERRLTAFLQRRGYDGSIVRVAVAGALGTAGGGTVED